MIEGIEKIKIQDDLERLIGIVLMVSTQEKNYNRVQVASNILMFLQQKQGYRLQFYLWIKELRKDIADLQFDNKPIEDFQSFVKKVSWIIVEIYKQ